MTAKTTDEASLATHRHAPTHTQKGPQIGNEPNERIPKTFELGAEVNRVSTPNHCKFGRRCRFSHDPNKLDEARQPTFAGTMEVEEYTVTLVFRATQALKSGPMKGSMSYEGVYEL